MNLTAGAILLNGKYRIDAEVGHGAFGVVYRATHLELNAPRAIKVLREDALAVGSGIFTTYRGRFRNEFRLAAHIDHPNVIKVYDFAEEDGALFAVMEYAPGGSLADLLAAKGPLEIEQAARLIRGAAEGLRALHEELEAIHRDIKPNNILLDRAGQAKVADFGLAQVHGFGMSVDSRLSGQAMPHPGTPNYASPEHANGSEPLTPSSDVYSLGCVAFELLTGKLWKSQQARARGPRDLRPEVPEWLDALVRRMLLRTPGLTVDDAGDPTKRFVDMRGVLAVLDPQLLSAEQALAGAEEKARAEAERLERLRVEEEKRKAAEREPTAKIARLREELAAAEGLGQIDAAERVLAAWLLLAPNDGEAVAARGRIAIARQRERDERAAETLRHHQVAVGGAKPLVTPPVVSSPGRFWIWWFSPRMPLMLGTLAILVVAALAVVFVIGPLSGAGTGARVVLTPTSQIVALPTARGTGGTSVLVGGDATVAPTQVTDPGRATSTLAPTPRPPLAPGTPTPAVVETIKFYSSHPLQGASKISSDGINNGYKLAIEQLTKAGLVCDGKFRIELSLLDDSTAARGAWDAATEQANATKAVADKDAMIYFGTLNSGAAKVAIPILNQGGMPMISAANTLVGLTKPYDVGEPDKYYPTGKRNYMRVVPADDFQGVVNANWIKGLGARSVYIVDDTELYGKGVADVMEKQSKVIGLEIKGRQGVTGKDLQGQANSVAARINGTKPDAVYYGGITANNAPLLLVELRKAGFRGIFMGPDGVQENEFINAAGKTADGKFVAEGIYATIGSVALADLPASGRKFLADYSARFGIAQEEIEVYSKYGYASMQVALAAIGKVCVKDRAKILEAMFATKDLDTVIGKLTLDKNGDTTSSLMTGYIVNSSGVWVETPIRQ